MPNHTLQLDYVKFDGYQILIDKLQPDRKQTVGNGSGKQRHVNEVCFWSKVQRCYAKWSQITFHLRKSVNLNVTNTVLCFTFSGEAQLKWKNNSVNAFWRQAWNGNNYFSTILQLRKAVSGLSYTRPLSCRKMKRWGINAKFQTD